MLGRTISPLKRFDRKPSFLNNFDQIEFFEVSVKDLEQVRDFKPWLVIC